MGWGGWEDCIAKEGNYATKVNKNWKLPKKYCCTRKSFKTEASFFFYSNGSFLVSITSCLRHGAHCLNFVMLELIEELE